MARVEGAGKGFQHETRLSVLTNASCFVILSAFYARRIPEVSRVVGILRPKEGLRMTTMPPLTSNYFFGLFPLLVAAGFTGVGCVAGLVSPGGSSQAL